MDGHQYQRDEKGKIRRQTSAVEGAQHISPVDHVQRAVQTGHLTPDAIQAMQATHGNQFVAQMLRQGGIQAKMTVTPAADQYESEADNVASQVVNHIQQQRIQREGAPEEEEPVQMSRIQREGAPEEEEPVQMSRIQREGAPEEEEVQMSRIQRVAFEQGGEVGGDIESSINQARSGGNGMDDQTKSAMEGAFGADFSGVRVHTDSQADAISRSIGAKAFTTGTDVFFTQGTYQPSTSEGQHLLAHELTHVVQQGGAQRKAEDE